MSNGIYKYQSEFARRFFGQGLEQGRAEGFENGYEEGRQDGLKRGREEGHLEGRRRALLKVLEARGLSVEGAPRHRLLACTDLAQLERWLSRAVKVQSIKELLPKPRPRPARSEVNTGVKARNPRIRR
jgi:predicted transposase YdaD